MLDALVNAFSGPGAAFMYAITAILAFGLAIVVERGWMFWVRWKVNEQAVLGALSSGDLEAAKQATGDSPPARLLAAGLGASTAEAAWDAMGAEAALVQSAIQRRVPYLAAAGNIATMLGLLGTIYGLILAFSALGDTSAVERASKLSEGIATAMATTAWGLLVAIPALAAHAFLESKAQQLLALCEAVASQVSALKRT